MLRRAVCSITICCALTLLCCSCADSSTPKKSEDRIREVIIDNLHLGPHLTKVTDSRTIKAVTETVDSDDIPALIILLSDPQAAVAVTSQLILIQFGNSSLPYLQIVQKSENPRVRFLAIEAIHRIQEDIKNKKPE